MGRVSPKEFTEWANAIGLTVLLSGMTIALLAAFAIMIKAMWEDLK